MARVTIAELLERARASEEHARDLARENEQLIALTGGRMGEAEVVGLVYLALAEFERRHMTGTTTGMGMEMGLAVARALLAYLGGEERPTARVVVEVTGGVAEVTSQPVGIEVEIIDHDGDEAA